MNKKELQEIRRQLKFDNERLLMRGFWEAYGKNKDGEASIQFLRLIRPDFLEREEGELYFEIFKKSLGGTFGRNLFEFGFDSSDPQAKTLQNRFYALKNGSLLDEKIFEDLASEILVKGDYRNPVYLTAGLFEYAAPGMNSAHEELEETSVFRFFIVAVSEARLTEIGLVYSRAANEVQRKVNEEMQILPSPLDAFCYPSFSQRASDVSHFLYHAKTAKSPNVELIEGFFHIPFASTAAEQQQGFAEVIAEAFPQGLSLPAALKFHENLSEYIRENSQEDAQVMLEKNRIWDLLRASGVPEEKQPFFNSAFSKILEDQPVAAVNLTESGKVSVKSPSITIQIKDEALCRIHSEELDGKRVLILDMEDGMEISGLPASLSFQPAGSLPDQKADEPSKKNPAEDL